MHHSVLPPIYQGTHNFYNNQYNHPNTIDSHQYSSNKNAFGDDPNYELINTNQNNYHYTNYNPSTTIKTPDYDVSNQQYTPTILNGDNTIYEHANNTLSLSNVPSFESHKTPIYSNSNSNSNTQNNCQYNNNQNNCNYCNCCVENNTMDCCVQKTEANIENKVYNSYDRDLINNCDLNWKKIEETFNLETLLCTLAKSIQNAQTALIIAKMVRKIMKKKK
eukprot:531027_1